MLRQELLVKICELLIALLNHDRMAWLHFLKQTGASPFAMTTWCCCQVCVWCAIGSCDVPAATSALSAYDICTFEYDGRKLPADSALRTIHVRLLLPYTCREGMS